MYGINSLKERERIVKLHPLFLFVTILILNGCACPDVVETKQISDENLTCAELVGEINKCDKSCQEIRDEKGFTGKNVAAAIFFWPALISTHSNVNDAVKALNDRKSHLVELYNVKRCQPIPIK